MKVRVIGEGPQEYPVLAIDRWKIHTLGMPSGGVRMVSADRLTVVPEPTGSQASPDPKWP